MERENRKRTTRDEEEREQIESRQGKKQECVSTTPPRNSNEYEFCEGIGIFDFPWLKEGAIFADHDDKFSPLDDAFAPNFESCVEEKLCVSPGPEAEFFGDDDSFWSLLVDVDREPVDCIWRCVIDQPLDTGFNKL